MGKLTFRGFRKPDDPVLKQRLIVLGRPWRTTAKDLARKKAKASDEKSPPQKAEKDADDAG